MFSSKISKILADGGDKRAGERIALLIWPFSTVIFSIKIKMEEDPDCTALLNLSRKLEFFLKTLFNLL